MAEAVAKLLELNLDHQTIRDSNILETKGDVTDNHAWYIVVNDNLALRIIANYHALIIVYVAMCVE